jgi:O-antigen/teichoic acid export membrane protein
VDQIVAGLFLGPASLGLYAVASSFTTLTMIVAVSVGVVEYPHVAGQPDRAVGRRTVVRYLLLTLALCGGIAVALELILPVLVPFLFGEEFSSAVPAARILVLAGVALAVRRILSDGLRALGRPTAGTIAELASWATLVPTLALFAPLFGTTGIAAAVAIASGVGAASLGVVLTRLKVCPPDPVGNRALSARVDPRAPRSPTA